MWSMEEMDAPVANVYDRSISCPSDLSEVFLECSLDPRPKVEEEEQSYESCQFSAGSSMTTSNSSPVSKEATEAGKKLEVNEKNAGEGDMCVVCNDKATGYHYGVFTCEGCKGFFKRTVQKQLEYSCRGDGNCEVNQFSRNRCQHCRFQKCVEQGMLKEAVREDRTPGGRHRHKSLQDHKQKKHRNSKDDDSSDSKTLTEVEESPTPANLVEPQEEGGSDFMEFIKQLEQDVTRIPEGDIPVSARKEDLDQLLHYAYQELYCIIQWAKRVPGFKEINLEDQVAMLKSCFMDLDVFRLSYRSIPCDPRSLMFAKQVVFERDEVLKFGWGEDIVDSSLEFTEKLRDLNIDPNEFACLSALVLLSPDVPELKDKQTIHQLQQNVNSCLKDYENSRYPNKPNRLGKLLLCLPTLRSYSEKALENYVTLEFFGKLDMPPLVAELLE